MKGSLQSLQRKHPESASASKFLFNAQNVVSRQRFHFILLKGDRFTVAHAFWQVVPPKRIVLPAPEWPEILTDQSTNSAAFLIVCLNPYTSVAGILHLLFQMVRHACHDNALLKKAAHSSKEENSDCVILNANIS